MNYMNHINFLLNYLFHPLLVYIYLIILLFFYHLQLFHYSMLQLHYKYHMFYNVHDKNILALWYPYFDRFNPQSAVFGIFWGRFTSVCHSSSSFRYMLSLLVNKQCHQVRKGFIAFLLDDIACQQAMTSCKKGLYRFLTWWHCLSTSLCLNSRKNNPR